LGRFLLVFALGILCVLVAMIAIMGHWVIAVVALGILALVVVVWGVIGGTGGTGGKAVLDPDRTDADLERAKTAQYMMRNKSQPPGGGL
jgi:hypothetical protein